jgi:hypothetical protein
VLEAPGHGIGERAEPSVERQPEAAGFGVGGEPLVQRFLPVGDGGSVVSHVQDDGAVCALIPRSFPR